MPIFDYQCTNNECSHTKEFIVSFSEGEDPKPKNCPKCKKEKSMLKVEKIYKSNWHPGKSFHNGGYVSN